MIAFSKMLNEPNQTQEVNTNNCTNSNTLKEEEEEEIDTALVGTARRLQPFSSHLCRKTKVKLRLNVWSGSRRPPGF